MAYVFGDGFDPYSTGADAFAGYWDSGSIGSGSLVAGRFAGSQAVNFPNTTVSFVKSSGQNDAVHHIVCAYRQTAVLSGATLGLYFQLTDVAANQVCIVFRQDGAILLTSATPGGTVLATYSGAVTAANTWFAFEFEVVINNTTGSFKVRKNGSTTDDHSTTGINTRPGANAYANKLTMSMNVAVNAQQVDDLFWQSGSVSGTFFGDIRCYTRMPASDAAAVFSRSTGATNFSCVDETLQNGATDYVFSANVNDADFYTIAPIAVTPISVVAVTTRGFLQKSDAGTRGAQVQLKSGAVTVGSTPTLLSSSFGWMWRTDLTDPNTTAAWTAAAVNNVQCGVKVTS